MAATETDAAPVVQEDGKPAEVKAPEAEQSANATNSETVETAAGDAVNSDATDNKETVDDDTAAAAAGAGAEEGEGPVASGDAAAPQENPAEPKTSLLDSFLNKSGLGKVMAGRKKKEPSGATAGGAADEPAGEGGEKEGEKGAEEGEEEGKTAPPNGEEEESKAEKGKGAEPKSTVRDLIRKPVAKIFSHRSNEKKDGAPAECQKPVKVRSRSLDRLEDPEALNAMADAAGEEGGAAAAAEAEGDQKASAATKHMKRWHSFKKMMAQKTHKKSGGGGDEKEEGAEGDGGGRDSSTLDSKDSGQQKRWKLKRSWTFQGLKRDSSIVGISGKAKGPDREPADGAKTEETAEGGEEVKEEGAAKEAKGEGEEEKEKDEGGEEEKVAAGGTVTQHANEIWTSFKKRVIPKSKRANAECPPGGEEDATAAAASGEDRPVPLPTRAAEPASCRVLQQTPAPHCCLLVDPQGRSQPRTQKTQSRPRPSARTLAAPSP